jgi:hypothetical protein
VALKQQDALITGLATAAIVIAVYQQHMPGVASEKASAPGNVHIGSARHSAALTAAAVVGGVSILAHDPTVFVIGGSVLIALDVAHRAANATDNQSGKIPMPSTDQTAAPTGQ